MAVCDPVGSGFVASLFPLVGMSQTSSTQKHSSPASSRCHERATEATKTTIGRPESAKQLAQRDPCARIIRTVRSLSGSFPPPSSSAGGGRPLLGPGGACRKRCSRERHGRDSKC